MRASKKVLVGLLVGIAFAACGPEAPPASLSALGSPTPAAPFGSGTAQTQTQVQGRFLHLDGSVDYEALRRTYGAPNTNIQLNPRATDVGQTDSRNSVQILDDRLIFDAADAQWLESKKAGDTLYCTTLCGAAGFGRNIVSIEHVGGQVVVLTRIASTADIIQNGWLHSEVPVTVTLEEEDGKLSVRSTTNEGTQTKSYTHGFKGTVSADIKPKHSFSTTVVSDFAYTYHHPTWSHPLGSVSIELIKFVVTGTETDSVEITEEAKDTYSQQYKFPAAKIPLAVIPLGPLVIEPELDLQPSVFAKASGAMKMSGSIEVSKELSAGFTYSDAAGFAKVYNSPAPKVTETISASGQATCKAGFALEAKLATKLYGVAGPDLSIGVELGAKASGEIKRTVTNGKAKCEAKVEASLYASFEGKVGAEVDVTIPYTTIGVTLEKSFTFADGEKSYPEPPWSKTWNITSPSALCPAEPGGSTGSTSTAGSTGTTSAAGSTGTTSAGGSSGGTGACTSNSQCWSQTGNANSICVNGGCCDSADASCKVGGSGSGSGSVTGGGTGGSTGGTGGTGGPCTNDNDCGGGQICCGGSCTEATCCPGGETCTEYTNDSSSVCSGGSCTCTCGDGTDCSMQGIGCRACAVIPDTCL